MQLNDAVRGGLMANEGAKSDIGVTVSGVEGLFRDGYIATSQLLQGPTALTMTATLKV